MPYDPELAAPNESPAALPASAASADVCVDHLSSLLRELQDVSNADTSAPPIFSREVDNQLAGVRLGIASSLFVALQYKHAATAGHALRVALTASAWALKRGVAQPERDHIELAALLHDVGVIGIPDHVLLKPGTLDSDETSIMAGARRMSLDILSRSCDAPEVLRIVEYLPAWFDGRTKGLPLVGAQIPLGSRMIAIVEAFDAMTTDRVYRPAMSLESAVTELFRAAGSQFDPELVRGFAQYQLDDQTALRREVAGRWLRLLDPKLVDSYWHLNCVPSPASCAGAETSFQARLLENMYDAVVFVDAGLRVVAWNRGAERLTGIAGTSIHQVHWQTDILRMSDEKGQPVKEADCPVLSAIRSGVQSLRRMTVWGRSGRPVPVDVHTFPVAADDGTIEGAILVLHDASSEISLEQRCQSLYDKATKDPMTQVANRAEFDRVHRLFVAAHQQQQVPCSMMICDLDRFKLVNDTFGHQAGDECIKSLAGLLKTSCRPGDLVARYGGEEFVMLYADCDNPTAARRAEEIRQALSEMPQGKLNGRAITASFGVTEVQPGDTPETMLRRADRALLMAKSKGRNTVVQLGSGSDAQQKPGHAGRTRTPDLLLEQDLVTPVPVKIAVEKLRGFVADHEARIVSVEENNVRLEIRDGPDSWIRRRSDRPVTFCLDIRLEEELLQKSGAEPGKEVVTWTKIHVAVSPLKTRDRRRNDVIDRAREVLISFRSYLMANDANANTPSGMMQKMRQILTPWRTR
jgi:diguanylate cyclase (GGDEF)-like protein/PAS domain S-box-containing protein